MTLRSSVANDLADATMKIVTANHYLVSYAQEVNAISWENFAEAHSVLVDRELKGEGGDTIDWELAFQLLDAECFRIHRTHLGT